MGRREDPLRETVPLTMARRSAGRVVRMAFRVRVTGLEHFPASGPVLVAGNHTGFLDGPVVFVLLPRPSVFLVKSELYDSPFRRVLEFARQIPVRRGTPDRTALRRALDVLRAGGLLRGFPPGTAGGGRGRAGGRRV